MLEKWGGWGVRSFVVAKPQARLLGSLFLPSGHLDVKCSFPCLGPGLSPENHDSWHDAERPNSENCRQAPIPRSLQHTCPAVVGVSSLQQKPDILPETRHTKDRKTEIYIHRVRERERQRMRRKMWGKGKTATLVKKSWISSPALTTQKSEVSRIM